MFSVSIALRVRDELHVAVVYDPCRQELFTASRGGGAQMDGRRVRVSGRNGLEGALIGTGFPYRSNTEWLPKYMSMLKADGVDGRRGADRGRRTDLCYVAAGRLDLLVIRPPRVDIAGSLMIREAGGIITSLTPGGDHLQTGDVIAGSPKVHEALQGILAPYL